MGGAGDGQRGQRPVPGPSRLGPGRAGPPSDKGPQPAGAGLHPPGRAGLRVRGPAPGAGQRGGVLHQVGYEPGADGRVVRRAAGPAAGRGLPPVRAGRVRIPGAAAPGLPEAVYRGLRRRRRPL